jgi:hypothetical protein
MGEWFANLTQSQPAAAIVSAIIGAISAMLVLFLTPALQRPLERFKGRILSEVERKKAELADEASVRNARRTYEFDARKRLFSQLGPLLFQLFEATEGSYYRVVSLVRTQKLDHLGRGEKSWLDAFGHYYFNSTIYRLFLPIVIYRLIQRSTTFVELNLDDHIQTKYSLLKLSYFAFTDHFVLAQEQPALPYDPDVKNWKTAREDNPALHWRQGLTIGRLDHLIDSTIVTEGDVRRPMNFGEFENAVLNNATFQSAFNPVADIFHGFSFDSRPVLARTLLAHAYLMRLLLYSYYTKSENVVLLIPILRAFAYSSEAVNDLTWWTPGDEKQREPVVEYLSRQLRDQSADAYTIYLSGRRS